MGKQILRHFSQLNMTPSCFNYLTSITLLWMNDASVFLFVSILHGEFFCFVLFFRMDFRLFDYDTWKFGATISLVSMPICTFQSLKIFVFNWFPFLINAMYFSLNIYLCVLNFIKYTSKGKDSRCLNISKKKYFWQKGKWRRYFSWYY